MKRAFTLIELLVVISIIAVLAGMLLPAISSVKMSAQGVNCSGMMRQFHMAAEAYGQDWDGSYLPSSIYVGWHRGWYMNSAVHEVIGGGWEKIGNDVDFAPRGLLCPSSAGRTAPYTAPIGYVMGLSYGINTTNSLPAWVANTSRVYNSARIRKASEKLAFIDARDWWVDKTQSHVYVNETTAASMGAAYRHRGGANITFFDGHVERRDRKQIDTFYLGADTDDLWEPYK